MSEFLVTVFGLSVIFALACALVSDKRFLRVERFLFSVIFSTVIFTSLAGLLKTENIPMPFPDGTAEESHLFDEVILSSLKRGMEEALREEFSLGEEDFEMTLSEVDEQTHLPRTIVVVLKKRGIFSDIGEMEEYLKEKGGFQNVRVSVRLDT